MSITTTAEQPGLFDIGTIAIDGKARRPEAQCSRPTSAADRLRAFLAIHAEANASWTDSDFLIGLGDATECRAVLYASDLRAVLDQIEGRAAGASA